LNYRGNNKFLGLGVDSGFVFHTNLNIFIQKGFAPLTVVDESSSWHVDEFGVVVPLLTFSVAIHLIQELHQIRGQSKSAAILNALMKLSFA
jgi:hypothetical protein